MLTPQTDSINCLALVLCRNIIVKCSFCCIYLLVVFYYHVYRDRLDKFSLNENVRSISW